MNKKTLLIFLTKLKSWSIYAWKYIVYIGKLIYWEGKRLITKYPKYAALIGILISLVLLGLVFRPQIIKFLNAPRPIPLTEAPKNSGFLYVATDKKTQFSAFIGATKLNQPEVKAEFSGGKSASFVLTETKQDIAKPAKRGNSVLFKNVRNDVDLEYQTLTNGIKENIIVKKKQEGNAFTFVLNATAASPRQIAPETYGSVFYDAEGHYVFHFAKPFAIDAKGVRTDNVVLATHKKPDEKNFAMTVIVNQKWLDDPTRVYPVTIDPTIVYSTSSQFAAGTMNRVTDTISDISPSTAASSDANTVGLFHFDETAPINATGGTITTSGGYTIHTFTTGGTLTVNAPGSVDYLLVGGGGGGGTGWSSNSNGGGGGGGGGGVLTGTTNVAAGAMAITVGTGGARGINGNGTNSTWNSLTAVGGGYGSSGGCGGVGSGGSGGGGGTAACWTPGSGTGGQGNNGGYGGNYAASWGAGGGGGAGAVGGTGADFTGVGGGGGIGVQSSITGSAVYYGGGGGGYNGGAGGQGGGTAGGSNTNGTNGLGGGGGGNCSSNCNGGNGVVIVRYQTPNYNLTDSSDNSQVAPTGTSVVSGVFGNARSFNGTTDYIDLGNPAKLGSSLTGSQTIEMWLYPTDFSARRNPYAKAYAGEGTITQETDGTLNYYYGIAGGNSSQTYQTFSSSTAIPLGKWSHIAIVRDLDEANGGANKQLKWYINGALVNQAAASFNAAVASSLNAYIGKGNVSNYAGYIDDVKISNIARTAAQIATDAAPRTPQLITNYQELSSDPYTVGLWHLNESSGNALDSSGNSNTGTPTGTTIVSGILGNARSFNGTSDYISVANNSTLNPTSAISVSVWFKTTDTAGGLVVKRSGNNGYRLVYSGGSLYWTVGNGSTIVQPNISGYNDGNWHFAEGTYDGSYAILYVDGVQQSSLAMTGPMTNTATALLIGDSDDQGKLAGTIDEVRVSNVARSAEEIRMDAQRRPYGVFTSDVMDLNSLTTGWNSMSWTELGVGTGDGEALANTSGLIAQWNFNNTGTTATVDAGSCPATALGCNSNALSGTGFGGDLNTRDSLAKSGWTADNKRWGSGALMLDGTNDYVLIPDNASLDSLTGNMTVEAWVNPSATQVAYADILSKHAGGNGGFAIEMTGTASSNKYYFTWGNGTASECYLGSTVDLLPNQWQHIAFSKSGSIVSGYLNGVLKYTCTGTSPSVVANANNLLFGQWSSGTGRFWNGSIDSTRIYNRALSASEVLSNYNATNLEVQTRVGTTTDPNDGTWEAWKPTTSEAQIQSLDADQANWSWDNSATYMPKSQASDSNIKVEGSGSLKLTTGIPQVDANTVGLWHLDETGGSSAYIKDSASTNHGTPTGTTVINGIAGKARSFNGSSDFITLGTTSVPTGNSNYTIEAWMYPTATGARGIVGWGNYGTNNQVNALRINSTNQIINYWWGNDLTVTVGAITTTWHHVAATFDGTTRKIYYDGSLAGSDTPGSSHNATSANFRIGNTNSTEYFSGSIDEVRISNVARSAEEIAETYRMGRDHYINRTLTSTDLSAAQKLAFNVAADRPGTYLSATIGNNAFANYQPDANTVGFWHLDENNQNTTLPVTSALSLWVKADAITGLSDGAAVSTWTDSSGNGRSMAQATGSKQPVYKTNIINGLPVVRFTASSAQQLTNATNFTTPVTIFYVGKQTGGANQRVLTSVSNNWLLGFWNGAKNQGYFEGWVTPSGSPATDTNWHVFSAVETGTLSSVYADGSLVASNASGVAGPNALAIGCWQVSSECSNADVAEVIVYNSSLSAAERAAVEGYLNYKYNLNGGLTSSYSVKDASGNNNGGSTIGTSFTQGKIGKGRSFNGTSDQIVFADTNALKGLNAVTAEAWINVNAQQDGGVLANTLGGYDLWYNSASGIRGEAVVTGGVGVSCYGGLLPIGKWTHVAMTYDKQNMILYVNGVRSCSVADTRPMVAWGATPLTLGNYAGYFNGSIDEVRVSNTARSAADIRAAYEYGKRSHDVTIDFGAKLDSGNLITGSGDTGFTVDATYYGLNQKGSNLTLGDKIIVRENYDGTTYIAQGTVNGIVASTGAITVISWDAGSTFPSSGFTANADVFKWQREYFDLTGSLSTQRNGITKLTLRETAGNGGRSIWLDDVRSVGNYLTTPGGSAITSTTGDRYFQYRLIESSSDYNVSSSVTSASLNFTTAAPDQPTNISSSVISTSQIRWSFTPPGAGNAPTGYKVFDTSNTEKKSCDTSNNYCDETGLIPNTSYTRKVAASNAGGNSPYTGLATAVTWAEKPPAATISAVSATSIQPTTVSAGYNNPAATTLAFYLQTGMDTSQCGTGGYYIAANGSNNGSVPVWQTAAQWNASPPTISGLNLDTTNYILCVKAINSAGVETAFAGNTSAGGYLQLSGDLILEGQNISMSNRRVDGSNGSRYVGGLDLGPSGWWKLNESSGAAADDSGNGLSLTNTSVTFAAGKYNNAGTFNGSAYLSCTDAACGGTTLGKLDFGIPASSKFSYGAWFKRNGNPSASEQILTKKTDADNTAGYAATINATGTVTCKIADGTNNAAATSAHNTYADNAWHYLVCVNDGTNLITYVDGVSDGSAAVSAVTATLNTTADFRIGENGNGTSPFTGSIDEVRVYRTNLSKHQIQKDMDTNNPQNVSRLYLKSGSLTINANETFAVGEIDSRTAYTGTVFIAATGQIKPGAPIWGVDGDLDGYIAGTAHYYGTKPSNGKRRFLLTALNLDSDCNDGDANIFLTHAQCYADLDKDTETNGLQANSTCLNTSSCATATYAGGTSGAATAYTAGQLLNSAGSQTDCYDNNPNVFHKTPGTGYCGGYRGQTAYGALVTDGTSAGNSYDYDCGGAATRCGNDYHVDGTLPDQWGDLGQSCPGIHYRATWTATQSTCGAAGSLQGSGWHAEKLAGCNTSSDGFDPINPGTQLCQ